ncbi:hypothetical protein [Streptomyces sp. NBC_00649]|uniref:hypothetical protein n=1 Tax=Streptomyces sp. NBC_00649 TaxID=2975798 RepID=UPI0032536D65
MVHDWFRVTTIDSTLTLIDEPHVHELLDANTWLVRGRDRDLLVDCGLGVGAFRRSWHGSPIANRPSS